MLVGVNCIVCVVTRFLSWSLKVIDRFLPLVDKLLSPSGLFYLLLLDKNRPSEFTICTHTFTQLALADHRHGGAHAAQIPLCALFDIVVLCLLQRKCVRLCSIAGSKANLFSQDVQVARSSWSTVSHKHYSFFEYFALTILFNSLIVVFSYICACTFNCIFMFETVFLSWFVTKTFSGISVTNKRNVLILSCTI